MSRATRWQKRLRNAGIDGCSSNKKISRKNSSRIAEVAVAVLLVVFVEVVAAVIQVLHSYIF